jgi:hypothetical protein
MDSKAGGAALVQSIDERFRVNIEELESKEGSDDANFRGIGHPLYIHQFSIKV